MIASVLFAAGIGVAQLAPTALTVEYRTDPVGLDAAHPRLSWHMAAEPGAKNERQTAYRVLVASSAANLAANRGDLWDSGRVAGDQSLNVEYAGRPVGSSQRVFWKVKTWNAAGVESDWSAAAKWTQGIVDGWKAKWIGFPRNPQPAFVKTFAVKKGLVSATLHITGLGYYVAWANGTRVGDKVLDPSPTSYDRRVLYSTYEIEKLLKEGENKLDVILGRGWYDVPVDKTWNFDEAPWRDRPRMIAQLELSYADGSHETVVSDESWKTRANPVAYDSLREAEVVGEVGPKPVLGAAAEVVPAPKGKLCAETQPGSKVMRTLRPVSVKKVAEGWMVSFAENIAGWVRLTARGLKKGAVVSVRYDERIEPDGSPAKVRMIDMYGKAVGKENPLPTGALFQCDRFVASGAAEETFEPFFNSNGFQYVLVSGLAGELRAEDVTACVVHTAFETVGRFDCSSEVLNKLMAATDLSYKGNFANGFPTDCPHREKNGWTGDAECSSELAQYLYENTSAYEKWMRDVCDAQLENGKVPGIIPAGVWGGVRDDWSYGPVWDPIAVVAWNLWCYRGDRRILEETYPALVKNVGYMASRADADGLVNYGLGDWCPVERSHVPSLRYTSSCYYYLTQSIAARIAETLGRRDDAAKFAAGAEKTKQGIFRRLRSRDQTRYDNGRQTAQALALSLRLMKPIDVDVVGDTFVRDLALTGRRLDVGIIGAKHLFRALSSAGYDDIAFEILTKPTGAGYADWIRNGSTTLWEDFHVGTSRNHIMYGDFTAWAYEYLAGIRPGGGTPAMPDPAKPGFKEFVIAPQPTRHLDFVSAETRSPYGVIRSSWRRADGKVGFSVTIPPNSSARVILPHGDPKGKVFGSGTWTFEEPTPSATVTVDFTKPLGRPIRAVNGVNNGPVRVHEQSKQSEFQDANISYMRTHDTYSMWGGSHFIDVPNVFPNFDADPDKEENYDFTFTDRYLKPFVDAGVKIYYRLGVTIENWNETKAYTTYPPKDPEKWARICEHVVAHYNRGWANGYRWNIEYWEIWNEPENRAMWLGTEEEFFNLYRVTANRLKAKFPEIKVGGYGACGFYKAIEPVNTYAAQAVDVKAEKWFPEFCRYVQDPKTKAPLDFFSWHLYVFGTNDAQQIVRAANFVRGTLDRHGLKGVESHFTEWNKTHGGHAAMKTAAGASFCASAFCVMQQQTDIEVATYYDALPSRSYCGLFEPIAGNTTACYEAFKGFGHLYSRGKKGVGSEVFTQVEGGAGHVSAIAAKTNEDGPRSGAFMIVNSSRTEACRIKLIIKGGAIRRFPYLRIDNDSNGLRDDGCIKSGDSVWLEPQSVVICRP